MKQVFRFREFPVYKITLLFTKDIRELAKDHFPNSEKYGLSSQITRAADSILLNIAEGSGKYSDLDFSRFLNQGLASLNEVVSCLDIARTANYIDENNLMIFLEKSDNIYRQLAALTAKVRNDSKK